MHAAVAVAQVNVLDLAGEAGYVGRRRADEMQMRDVAVGPHGLRQADLAEERQHRVDRVDERQPEGPELDRDLHAVVGGLAAELADGLDARPPLLGRRNHLLLPDVFTEHEQQIRAAEFGSQIDEGAAAIEVKPTDRRIEVDEPEGDAAQAHDRQVEVAAGVFDQGSLGGVDVERIGEDVDRVEAESLRLFEAEAGAFAGLGEGRVDEAEFHAGGSWGDGGAVVVISATSTARCSRAER